MTANNDHKKARFPSIVGFFRWSALAICWLEVAYSLLRCYWGFSSSLDDMRKFSGLGFDYPFTHYLMENDILEAVFTALHSVMLLVIFMVYYRKAKKNIIPRSGLWYFWIMIVFQTVLCVLTNVQCDFAPANLAGVWLYLWCFVNLTMLPAVIYFVLYILRVRKVKALQKQ